MIDFLFFGDEEEEEEDDVDDDDEESIVVDEAVESEDIFDLSRLIRNAIVNAKNRMSTPRTANDKNRLIGWKKVLNVSPAAV